MAAETGGGISDCTNPVPVAHTRQEARVNPRQIAVGAIQVVELSLLAYPEDSQRHTPSLRAARRSTLLPAMALYIFFMVLDYRFS
jgi:hypothetical protein